MEYKELLNRWENIKDKENTLYFGFLIKFIFNTNKLEGINLTYHQTKEIFERETIRNYDGDIRELFSVLNSRNTYEFILKSLEAKRDIDIDFIKDLHKKVMRNSYDKTRYEAKGERAGEFKKNDYIVGRLDTGVQPEFVKENLIELLKFLKSKSNIEPLKVATVLHCEFECIHPFSDGNGRVGRWLMNYYLLKFDKPPIIIFSEDKNQYYNILENYDKDGNPELMYNFLEEQCIKTWSKQGRKDNLKNITFEF